VPQALRKPASWQMQAGINPARRHLKTTLDKLADINNWDIGSALRVKDDMWHAEGQVDVSNAISPTFKKQTGVDCWRALIIVPISFTRMVTILLIT
jgi:hypothetical protein